jgi:putative intracellular protease/amidase
MRAKALFLAACVLSFPIIAAGAEVTPHVIYVCPMADHPQEFSKPGFCPLDGMELTDKNLRLRVAVLVHEGVEEIDYAGPLEVFGWSGAVTFTVGPTTAILHSAFGLQIQPDFDFEHAPPSDLLLIPGGGILAAEKNEKILQWIRERSATSRYVMSVCNGAFILARTGLLDGLSATTTATANRRLATVAPKTHVVQDRRFVDNGKIITTAGLSSGIDGALHVIERQYGRVKAEEIARDVEYHWEPDGHWTRGSLADLRMPDVLPLDVSWEKLADHGDTRQWEVRGRLGTSQPVEEFLNDCAKRVTQQNWKLRESTVGRRAFERTDDGTMWIYSIVVTGDGEPSSYLQTMTIREATARKSRAASKARASR